MDKQFTQPRIELHQNEKNLEKQENDNMLARNSIGPAQLSEVSDRTCAEDTWPSSLVRQFPETEGNGICTSNPISEMYWCVNYLGDVKTLSTPGANGVCFQVEVTVEVQDKTWIRVHQRLLRSTCMTFGLKETLRHCSAIWKYYTSGLIDSSHRFWLHDIKAVWREIMSYFTIQVWKKNWRKESPSRTAWIISSM